MWYYFIRYFCSVEERDYYTYIYSSEILLEVPCDHCTECIATDPVVLHKEFIE